MKNYTIIIFFAFLNFNSKAQISGSSIGNATCEDFILDKGKIYFTGSYQNFITFNNKDSFNSNSPGSFLLGSVDTLLENFKPIIGLSNGSFIRGQKIANFDNGQKIIICLTNGKSEIEGNKIESNGGWDILLLLLNNKDKLIDTYLIGSTSDEEIIHQSVNGMLFSLLFKSGSKLKINNKISEVTINDFGYLLFQLNLNNMQGTFYKISEPDLSSKICFVPLSFQLIDNSFNAFGYYATKENIGKTNPIKDFGILYGILGSNYRFKSILRCGGMSSKVYYKNNNLVFDITTKGRPITKSSFYSYKNGELLRLGEDVKSKYHTLGGINKIDDDKYYCVGSYQNFVSNINNLISSEDGGSFIYYFDFKSNENLLEDIPQENIAKSIYHKGYSYTSSSYTNTGSDKLNAYNNFKIDKVKIDYITRYEILKKELENKKSIIYPNPAINTVSITTKFYYHNLKLKLTNANGQLIYETLFKKDSKNIEIDVMVYPSGNYFIELYQDNNLISKDILMICR